MPNIQFLDEPFEDCATSCLVIIEKQGSKVKERHRLGVIDAQHIYQRIEKGRPISIKNRFVKDFSMSHYRASKGLEKDVPLEIVDLDAEGSYFQIESEMDFSYVRFTGSRTSFKNCSVSDGPVSFYHAHFETDIVSFEGAQFGVGVVNFQYAHFASKEADFDNFRIQAGEVQFISAVFGDAKVSFKGAHFGESKLDFHYSKFGQGNLSFDKATFQGGDISFKRVDFGDGKLDFKRVQFGNGLVDFSEAEFRTGKVVFRSSVFGTGNVLFDESTSESDLVFDNAEFAGGKLSFFGATAYTFSFQYCQFNNYVDLRVEKAHRVDLSYCIVRDIVDMIPTERSSVQLDQFVFSGMRNLGNLYVDWTKNKVLKLIMTQEDTSMREKCEQFLILKETYSSNGRYGDEDKAYVWYKRMELKAEKEHALAKDSKNAFWAYPSYFIKWFVFDLIGLYATDPIRVLYSVAVIYTSFSLLYIGLPYLFDTAIETTAGEAMVALNPIAKSFYFSAITFLTVGYGDFFPVGILRFFASVEGYVGVFLMGYFSVAFVRKVLR